MGERGRRAAAAGHTGLYHVALLYPDRPELARGHAPRARPRLTPVDHATDHGGTVSAYLADPDGNGVELYVDRPRCSGSTPTVGPVLRAERFDYHELLSPDTPS